MANWWSLFREIRGRSEKGQVCDRTVEETWCFWKISFAELECHERQSGSLVGLQDRPRLAIFPFVFSLQIAPTQVCWAFYVRWQRGTTRIRAPRCCAPCSSRSIYPADWTHSNKLAAASLLLWAHTGRDRRTPTPRYMHRWPCSP